MSADELRARLAELAAPVVPMDDPHGRLMSRRRKRFRTRIASLATVTAAVLAGGVAAPSTMLSFGARPELPPPEAVMQSTTAPTAAEYVDRLVRAPIRGNLSDDKKMVAEVQKVFSEFEPKFQKAKNPNLVFLNRTDHMLQAVVVYTGGDEPVAVARGSSATGPVKELIEDPMGFYSPITPFLVVPISAFLGKARALVGLAPPGCAIEHSDKGGFTSDGDWIRTYESEPTGDYIMRQGSMANELWRVSCEGRVREVRIADDYLDSAGVEENATAMYDRVVRYSGSAPPGKGMVQWRGRLPGLGSQMTLVSPRPLPGPAMLTVGPFTKAVLATDLPEQVPVPLATTTREPWPMVSLGVAGEGITVVRVPEPAGDRVVLGDQVLVYTDTTAARVEALDPGLRVVASSAVTGGLAVLTLRPGFADAVRTVTSRGMETSSVRFVEPEKGSRVLGDQLFKDW